MSRRASPPSDDLVALFKALADRTRLGLLLGLAADGPLCVGALQARVGLSQPAVSHQLSRLRAERLVRARRRGREVLYELDDEHVVDVLRAGQDHVGHGRRR